MLDAWTKQTQDCYPAERCLSRQTKKKYAHKLSNIFKFG